MNPLCPCKTWVLLYFYCGVLFHLFILHFLSINYIFVKTKVFQKDLTLFFSMLIKDVEGSD